MFYYTENLNKPTFISCYNLKNTNNLLFKYTRDKIDSSLKLSIKTTDLESETGLITISKKEDQEDFSYTHINYKVITINIDGTKYKVIPNNLENDNFKIIKDDGSYVSKSDLLKIKEIIELNFLKDIEKEKYKNEDAIFIYSTILEQINVLDNFHIPTIFDPSFTEKPSVTGIKTNKVSILSKNKEKEIIKQLLLLDGGNALKTDFFDIFSDLKNCIFN